MKKQIKTNKVIKRAKIEHCDKKECLRCGVTAYNRGKNDERQRIYDEMREYASRGFELQTALESCFVEPMEQAIFRNKVKLNKRDKLLEELDEEMLQNYPPIPRELYEENKKHKKSLWKLIKDAFRELMP